jgi:predicted permease
MANRDSAERDLTDEVLLHIELETQKNVERGMTPDDARRRALMHFGGVERIKEECREEKRGYSLDVLTQDARFALRTLGRSPGFAAAAILTLALGIGANTAIFSLVNGVLLRPLPYEEGDRLVLLQQAAPKAGIDNLLASIREVYDYREQNETLTGLVEHHSMTFTLLGREEPERVSSGVVSADFFDVLGVKALSGRTFEPGDDDLGADAVLMLSHGYWQRSFGGDPRVVGQTFQMNDRPHTVIGVLPAIPQFPVEHDIYMPTSACPFRAQGEQSMDQNRSAFRMMTMFGRLRPGVSLEEARADFARLGERFQNDFPDTYPEERGFDVSTTPLQSELTRGARPMLLMLLGTSGLVLLIGCANVANLTVARLLRREREMALRASLGAGRARLARQLVVESTILTLTGGACGLLLAYAGLDLLVAFTSRFTPRAAGITIDGWVLVFTFGVSVLTGIAFGAIPALPSKVDLFTTLREGDNRATGHARHRLRSGLVAAQVAVAVVLLAGAGLMLRSTFNLQQVDPGFDAERTLSADITLNWSKYVSQQDRIAFFDRLLERVQSHPGVIAAAVSNDVPLSQTQPIGAGFQIEGRPIEDGGLTPQMEVRTATPDYFHTMGVPLLRGRRFRSSDDGESRAVAIISQSLARKYWGREDPLDERVASPGSGDWITIVGIVGDVRQAGLDAAGADELYLPLAQAGFGNRLVVRTADDPLRMANAIKRLVWEVDPEQPVADIRSMEDRRQAALASPRLTASLLGLFALVALAITATGIGGVVAYSVGQRTREIGVRMALGAHRSGILLMILRQGMVLTLTGVVLGLVVSLTAGRVLSDFLFEIAPSDPVTLASVCVVLIISAAIACLLPARRATAVDPTTALRGD